MASECFIQGRTEPVAIHYDSGRIMNVQGHGSRNLFHAIKSFLGKVSE